MKLSVCVATYNGELFIRAQIESIVDQIRPCDELIVSDDGSKDFTIDIVKSIYPAAKIISQERVGGVVRNFERALTAATGDIVVLCDQDDVWLPGRLDFIRRQMLGCDLLLCNGTVVDHALRDKGIDVFSMLNVRAGFLQNLSKNSFIGCCMSFRRDLLDVALPFPKYLPWHDWYIGLIAELFYKVERSSIRNMMYRRHSGAASPTGVKSSFSIYKKILMRLQIGFGLSIVFFRIRRLGFRNIRRSI
jgi:glycosyltransferase involved in cell wall biosynthesis